MIAVWAGLLLVRVVLSPVSKKVGLGVALGVGEPDGVGVALGVAAVDGAVVAAGVFFFATTGWLVPDFDELPPVAAPLALVLGDGELTGELLGELEGKLLGAADGAVEGGSVGVTGLPTAEEGNPTASTRTSAETAPSTKARLTTAERTGPAPLLDDDR